jgi:pheromone receptor transcription factor
MSSLANTPAPARKPSNPGSHSTDLPQQDSNRGTKREHDEDDGAETDEDESGGQKTEKRAGRRKIKIEYIDDKSRRHITFSKRKAGIMKKAYELSTLTGTQVLLLVVSETGLVYTFTTPKLQPLVTKPEGKNLIQACLNAPDPPQGQDTSNPSRPQQQAPVYGSDNTSSVDNNSDGLYNDDRKHQSPNSQVPTSQNYLPNLPYGNQYGLSASNLPINANALASNYNYMPTQYPQHSQPYMGQYPQSNYMPATTQHWGQTNANGNAQTKPPQQFSSQTEKK